ncbi:hypothetical protein CHELA41_20023 [Hyphomicrobiales bacterium]|nr:hypothetical protein CHELA41_20023 [Hyphomicrobiales bacterium]
MMRIRYVALHNYLWRAYSIPINGGLCNGRMTGAKPRPLIINKSLLALKRTKDLCEKGGKCRPRPNS